MEPIISKVYASSISKWLEDHDKQNFEVFNSVVTIFDSITFCNGVCWTSVSKTVGKQLYLSTLWHWTKITMMHVRLQLDFQWTGLGLLNCSIWRGVNCRVIFSFFHFLYYVDLRTNDPLHVWTQHFHQNLLLDIDLQLFGKSEMLNPLLCRKWVYGLCLKPVFFLQMHWQYWMKIESLLGEDGPWQKFLEVEEIPLKGRS